MGSQEKKIRGGFSLPKISLIYLTTLCHQQKWNHNKIAFNVQPWP